MVANVDETSSRSFGDKFIMFDSTTGLKFSHDLNVSSVSNNCKSCIICTHMDGCATSIVSYVYVYMNRIKKI